MALAITTLGCSGQNTVHSDFGNGNIRVSIEQGNEWLHDFSIFWFIKKKNAPQIAIWTEDLGGNFLSTIYVSEKLAKQSWMAAGGNRRKESLPCWSYAQGKQYVDGLYLPTKNEPLPDAVTGATPKGSFTANLQMNEDIKQFVVKFANLITRQISMSIILKKLKRVTRTIPAEKWEADNLQSFIRSLLI